MFTSQYVGYSVRLANDSDTEWLVTDNGNTSSTAQKKIFRRTNLSCFGNPEIPAAGKRVMVSAAGQCTQRIGSDRTVFRPEVNSCIPTLSLFPTGAVPRLADYLFVNFSTL
jgi:hypothetical protein